MPKKHIEGETNGSKATEKEEEIFCVFLVSNTKVNIFRKSNHSLHACLLQSICYK